jgi:hypothetical protein
VRRPLRSARSGRSAGLFFGAGAFAFFAEAFAFFAEGCTPSADKGEANQSAAPDRTAADVHATMYFVASERMETAFRRETSCAIAGVAERVVNLVEAIES